MFSRNLVKTASRNLKTFADNKGASYSLNQNFLKLNPLMVYKPTRFYHSSYSNYEQKVITSDEDGRVIVKTLRKESGKPWETHVEEYKDGKKMSEGKKPEAIDQSKGSGTEGQTSQTKISNQQQKADQTTSTSTSQGSKAQNTPTQSSATESSHSENDNPLSKFEQSFHSLADSMMKDFEHFFDTGHPFSSEYNFFEPRTDLLEEEDDSNTTYHSRTVINNNGQVTVKTVTKRPGGKWETSVKQYSKDDKLEEGKKTDQISDAGDAKKKAAQRAETDKIFM